MTLTQPKRSKQVTGAGKGLNDTYFKKKRRKTFQLPSSKMVSHTDTKGHSGSKVFGYIRALIFKYSCTTFNLVRFLQFININI